MNTLTSTLIGGGSPRPNSTMPTARRSGAEGGSRMALSPDPQFIDKVRDVAGLYLNPPEAAVVLCVDEKQIQALDRTAPILPLMPAAQRRKTTADTAPDLFAALDAATGKGQLDKEVPQHLDVHIVLDNVSTHKTPSIQRWLVRHPRFSFHFNQRHRPQRLHQRLDRQLEQQPQTLHMAQDRRRDTRQPRLIYPTNSPDRTLGVDRERLAAAGAVAVDAEVGVEGQRVGDG